MQGKAQFKLIRPGVPGVCELQEVNNTILPTVSEFINRMIQVYNLKSANGQAALQNSVLNFLGLNTFKSPDTYGLILNSTAKDTTTQAYVQKFAPMAYAFGPLTPSNILGTLISSSAILDENLNQVGIQFIWSFPAGSATGTIASISLTSRELSGVPRNFGTYAYTVSDLDMLINGRMRSTSFIDSGDICDSLTGVRTIKEQQPQISATGVPFDIVTTPLFIAHFDLASYKVLDDTINNLYITITKDSSNYYSLVTIDKDTKDIVSSVSISCVNALTFYDFGLCGDFLVLLSSTDGNIPPLLYVVNLNTNTYTTLTPPSVASTSSYSTRCINTYNAIEGGYACDINYSNRYNYVRYVEIYAKVDGSGIEFSPYYLSASSCTNHSANIALGPICLNVYSTSSGSTWYVTWGIVRRALYSICNLTTPIVKEAADTLEITYDLTWA